MALKKPNEKILSSFATFEFTCKELVYLQNSLDRNWLLNLPDATVQKANQFDIIVVNMRLSVFGFHVEVMQQSLQEYLNQLTKNKNISQAQIEYIKELIEFLRFLRNALLHAKGELIPRWDINAKKMQEDDPERYKRLQKFIKPGFAASIPVLKEPGGLRFNEQSNVFKKIIFKIRLNKNISLSKDFISKLRLLSWHVLTITKKKKIETLAKYLKQSKNLKS